MNPTEKQQSEEEVLKEQEAQEAKEAVHAEENTENGSEEENAQEEKELTADELLQKELEEAKETIASQNDKYLRLSAEFDNYRKRTLREKAELLMNGGEKAIKAILPIIDDLERAIKNMETTEETKAMLEGVELIYNKFLKTLEQEGLKVIETQEKDFDTDFHEAIAMIPAPSEALKGKILDCVQTGYMLHDKVIRHAKVVVAQS